MSKSNFQEVMNTDLVTIRISQEEAELLSSGNSNFLGFLEFKYQGAKTMLESFTLHTTRALVDGIAVEVQASLKPAKLFYRTT
jgi:hypothetical protein